MMQLLEQMEHSGLFRGLSKQALQELLIHGRVKKYIKGAYLVTPQESLDQFGLVLSGKLHTIHQFMDGNWSIMDVLEDGDIFGADLICTKSRISPYHTLAATDAELLLFPWNLPFRTGALPDGLRQELQLRILRLVANSNIQKEYRLAILSQKGIRERIMTYLQMQASKRKVKSFDIPFSREDLASFLCVNRSALSHELSKMQAEGLIQFHKNRFTVLWD